MRTRRAEWTNVVAAIGVLLAWAGPVPGKTVTWTGSANLNWDFASVNWTNALGPQTYADGDDVAMANWPAANHYQTYNIAITAGGVTPGSFAAKPLNEGIRWRFSGGDIKGATGIDVQSGAWPHTYLNFDGYTNSLSFSGGVNMVNGRSVEFSPTLMGVAYGLGTGPITVQAGGTFTFSPTVTNCTLTNTIIAASTLTTFNWANYPKFSGDLQMNGDVYFNSVGGGYLYFDWLGNVILSGDRRITGGVRDLAGRTGGGLHFAGQFQGPTNTLTMDFQNSADVSMQATLDTGAWNIGNLILDNGTGNAAGGGNTPSLLVWTTNPTDDHFGTLRGNGGKVTIQNNAQLYMRRGSIDGNDVRGGPGASRILVDQVNAAYDVRVVTNPLQLGTTSNRINLLRFYGGGVPAVGTFQGNINVNTGGIVRLETNYGHLIRHDGGNLRLLDGSRLDAVWSSTTFWSAGYRVGTAGQQILLGDGSAATQERITFAGNGSADNGVFAFGVTNSNVVDDGNVILRYEQDPVAGTCFNMGWTDLASVQALSYAANTITYPFRGGSAGTEFAPYTNSATWVGAIGPVTGTVFTATSPTRLVTAGRVRFCNSDNATYAGHRGNFGKVVIGAGGTFDLQATGIVETATLIVTNGGSISGIGTFACTNGLTVYNGSVSAGPSLAAGTLSISNNFTLSTNSVLSFDLGTPGVIGGGTNDLITVAGNVTLAGTVYVSALPGFATGTYLLMNYTGSLVNNGLSVASMPPNFKGTITVDSLNKQVWLNSFPAQPGMLIQIR